MSDDRLHYEEIAKGLTWETGGITVTESHILAFAGLSGDFYDLHVDDDYARSLGFPGKVAHGLLGLALADGLKNRSSVRLAAIVSLGLALELHRPDPGGGPDQCHHSGDLQAHHAAAGARPRHAVLRPAKPARGDSAARRERYDGAPAE